MKTVLFIFLLLYSTLSFAEPMDVNQQFRLDIERSIESERYELLLAGEHEIQIFTSESHTPITKGVAVLINEYAQAPLGHMTLAPLVEHLNNTGWVTIVMPAPSLALLNQQANDEQQLSPKAFSDSPFITEQSFQQQEQQLMLQMRSVVQKTEQYPGFFLVIAQGTSAAWLIKLYAEQQLETPDALISLAAYWPIQKWNKQLPQLMAQTSMPILDIYNRWGNNWTQKTIEQRRIAAVKELKMHYRQREIIGQPFDKQQFNYLGKEIYGWLTYMGW